MAFATFSGPVRIGTVRENARRNTGLVVLGQSFNSGSLAGREAGTVDTQAFIIPQGSQIVDLTIDQIVATTGTGASTTISVGTTSGGSELKAAVVTTAGGRFRGTSTAATQAAWQTSTTADTTIFVRNVTAVTGSLTTGQFILTVTYIQRAPNGTQNPVSA